MNENPSRDLARCAVEVARIAPELMPALLWLVATGGRTQRVKAYRRARPSAEELAALTVYAGEPVCDILARREAVLKRIHAVDIADRGLQDARASALRRLGLGIESLIETSSEKGHRVPT